MFSLYTIILSANRVSLTFSFSILMHFFFLSPILLTGTYIIMLKRNFKGGHFCLVPNLSMRALKLSLVSLILDLVLHICPL